MSDKPTIIIYSAPWCAFCHAAKAYLDSKKIAYKDINVDADHEAARELVEKSGQTGIPVIYIGDEMIIGFDRPRLDSALRAAKLI